MKQTDGKRRLNFLITNDDGIQGEGLLLLAQAAAKLGDVWVLAPEQQCSAMSSRMTIHKKMRLKRSQWPELCEVTQAAWSLDGMPVDCVKAALNYCMPLRPDFVLSGVNCGYNTAFDVRYSGTIGAAMEGLTNGIPSIAFSSGCDSWETATAYLPGLLAELIRTPVGKNEILNVNFPDCPAEQCRGIRRDLIPAPRFLYDDAITVTEDSDGSIWLSEDGELLPMDDLPRGTDAEAIHECYIAIGRLCCPEIYRS